MVQIFDMGPSRGALQAQILGQGLNSLGEGLGAFYNNYRANKDFEELENNPKLSNKPYSERLQAAQQVARKHGKLGEKIFNQRLQIEQQAQQERRSQILNKIYNDQPLSKGEERFLDPKDFEQVRKMKMIQKQKPLIKDALVNAGMDENRAEALSDLYVQGTLGGQTELMKPIADFISRQGHSPSQSNNFQPQRSQENEWPPIEEPYKPTPGEEFKRSSKREDTNIPIYNENNKKVYSLEQEGMSIDRLQQLSPKMPEGFLGKANIDFKTGELRIPAGANAETQLYAKTLNDFTTKAKDSYGSRVTNFDLSQFMKRLPTLANSKEGRDLILQQMKIINELNLLHDKGLKETFDHYGVGRINSQEARKIADQRMSQKKEELLERYKTLDGKLNKMENPENGQRIKVKSPDGKVGYIPLENAEKALKAGYERIE